MPSFYSIPTVQVPHIPRFQGSGDKKKTHSMPLPTTSDTEQGDTYVGGRSAETQEKPARRSRNREGNVVPPVLTSHSTSHLPALLAASATSVAMAPASPSSGKASLAPPDGYLKTRRPSLGDRVTNAALKVLPQHWQDNYKSHQEADRRIEAELAAERKQAEDPGDIDRNRVTEIPLPTQQDKRDVKQYYDEQVGGLFKGGFLRKQGRLRLKADEVDTSSDKPETAYTEAVIPLTAQPLNARNRTGSDLSAFLRDVELEYEQGEAALTRSQQNIREEDELRMKSPQKKE